MEQAFSPPCPSPRASGWGLPRRPEGSLWAPRTVHAFPRLPQLGAHLSDSQSLPPVCSLLKQVQRSQPLKQGSLVSPETSLMWEWWLCMLPQPRALPGDPASSKDTSPMDVPGRGSLPPWNSTTSIRHPTPQAAKCFYYLQHLKRKVDCHFVSLAMGLEDRDLVFLTLLWGLLQGALAPRDTVGRRAPCSTAHCSSHQHGGWQSEPERGLCVPRGAPQTRWGREAEKRPSHFSQKTVLQNI